MIHTKNKRFTLIELLVVVAILGILASLLLPALGQARQKAKIAICKSNQKQIGFAIYMYADDNDDHLPGHLTNDDGKITYDDFLGMGYDGRNLTLAEARSHSLNMGTNNEKIYSCPTYDTNKNGNRSYSAVQGKLNGTKNSKRGPIEEGSGKTLKIQDIRFPSDTIILSEWHTQGNVLGKNNTGMIKMKTIQNGTLNGTYIWSHGEFKFNHLLADGSVRAISHVATYAGSGSDPWTSESMLDTMWDSLR